MIVKQAERGPAQYLTFSLSGVRLPVNNNKQKYVTCVEYELF